MTYFDRIFWKIFLALWLMCIFVMTSTAYVIHITTSQTFQEIRQKEKVSLLAQEIIKSYLSNQPHANGRTPQIRALFSRLGIEHKMPVLITRDDEIIYASRRIVFDNKKYLKSAAAKIFFGKTKNNLKKIEITESDKKYTVTYSPPRHPRKAGATLKSIISFQTIMMLLSATLVSMLLSWLITSPLKILSRFSRNYQVASTEANQLLINPKLIQRGDELGDLARAITQLITNTRDSFTAQKNLLHDVSHELRAPLARLQTLASLIEQEHPNSKITKIHAECSRIDRLIQQILNFSRLDSQESEAEYIDISQLVEEIHEDVKLEFPNRLLIFTPLPDAGVTAIVSGVPAQLRQAIENILRNACLHTPENTAVDTRLSAHETEVVIVIRDYGAGIRESEKERLTEPFYRAGGKMHTQGFGLGLSIALRSIQKHNGKLELQNCADGGLEVTISLPRITNK